MLFKSISDRIAELNLRLAKGLTARFIAVYMAHSQQPDAWVEANCEIINAECREGKAKNRKFIIAGDFNAKIQDLKQIESKTWMKKLNHVTLGAGINTGLRTDFKTPECIDHFYIGSNI